MKKKLIAQGNGWMLYINKDLCNLIHINKNDNNVMLQIHNKILYIHSCQSNIKQKQGIKKRVIKRGNAFGIYLSKTILNLLDINPEVDNVIIDINSSSLQVQKVN